MCRPPPRPPPLAMYQRRTQCIPQEGFRQATAGVNPLNRTYRPTIMHRGARCSSGSKSGWAGRSISSLRMTGRVWSTRGSRERFGSKSRAQAQQNTLADYRYSHSPESGSLSRSACRSSAIITPVPRTNRSNRRRAPADHSCVRPTHGSERGAGNNAVSQLVSCEDLRRKGAS
jgi:hypothetical protein